MAAPAMNPVRSNDQRVANSSSSPNRASPSRERMTARPAVLRALTDLFCLRNDPIEEEIQRFRELALQIIPDAGPSTRLYVAAKLARHPMAPREVLAKLAENDPACATLIIEHARNYPVDAQLEAAINGDRAIAVALAARAKLTPSVSEALVSRNDPHVTRALADNPTAKVTPAIIDAVKDDSRPDRIYAEKLQAKAPAAPSQPEGFLAANGEKRASLIATARRASLGHATTTVMRDENLVAQLMDHAIDRRWTDFASALAQKTALREDVVHSLIGDAGGEPLALILSLVGVEQAEAIRIFLCCDTSISHSYVRVRDLSLIAAETPARVAGALLFGMTNARPRISTYADTPERRTEALAQGVRGVEPKPIRAPAPAAAAKTQIILRRHIR
jgi:uncharacterized protein (DUF2336 family)